MKEIYLRNIDALMENLGHWRSLINSIPKDKIFEANLIVIDTDIMRLSRRVKPSQSYLDKIKEKEK